MNWRGQHNERSYDKFSAEWQEPSKQDAMQSSPPTVSLMAVVTALLFFHQPSDSVLKVHCGLLNGKMTLLANFIHSSIILLCWM